MVYTVWRFSSPSTNESVLAVRAAEPGDQKYQHEYQRIVWRGEAQSRKQALEQVRAA